MPPRYCCGSRDSSRHRCRSPEGLNRVWRDRSIPVPPDSTKGHSMKLLNKRRQPADAAPIDEDQAPPAKIAAANWTRGQQLATTATRVVLWGMVACAPLALGVGAVALSAAARPAPQSTIAAAPTEPPGRLQATGMAEHAVMAWLGASRGSEHQVSGLLPSADLPAKGLNVSAPGAVDSVWDGSAWIVTVGVTVTSDVPTDQGATTQTVHRRFFQVPVAVDADGILSVLMLPAEVAGPTTAAPSSGAGFRSTVPSTHPVAVAAVDFLTALLAGGGDITRYISPESGIRAVTPAPYVFLTVESVMADHAPATSPAEGDSVVVMVRTRALDATESATRFDYVLAMSLRSSRWEITEIKGSPLLGGEEVPVADPDPSPIPTSNTNP